MKKISLLGLLVLGLVLSIACGGGGDDVARSIQGGIDSSVVDSSDGLEVWALDKDGRQVRKGTIIPAADGVDEDMGYEISGLLDNYEYTVVLYKVYDGVNKLELLSTVVTTSAETSSGLAKPKWKRQMNTMTTYISRKYRAARAASPTTVVLLTTVIAEVIPAGADLDSLASEGGVVTVGGSAAVLSPVAEQAIFVMNITVASVVSMTNDAIAAAITSINAVVATISSAKTADDVLTSAVTASLDTVTKAADQTVLAEKIAEVDTGISDIDQVLENIESGDTEALADAAEDAADTNSGETPDVDVAASFSIDAAYGTVVGDNFTISTLNPVFKVSLTAALDAVFTNVVSITFTNNTSNETVSLDTALGTKLTTLKSTDGKTVYVMVMAKDTELGTSGWLQPGTTYSYAITEKSGYDLALTGGDQAGTITTKAVTCTLPYVSGESQINLGVTNAMGTGATPTLYIHSSKALTKGTGDTYGILDQLTWTLTKGTTEYGSRTLTSSDVVVTLIGGTSTSFTGASIALQSGAALTASTSYSVAITGDLDYVDGSTDYPVSETLKLDVK
ncbi:MAG: hypothetical protein HQL32_03470 [Planctomycetes bacterium]|nr:hypothetical protein [Planctomycetota bacterium]